MPYILVLITREVSSTCFIEPLINFTNFITSHFPAKAAAAKIILVFCNFSLFSWKFGKNGNLTHLFPTLWQRYVDEEKQQWFSEKSKPKSQWFLTKFSLHYYFPFFFEYLEKILVDKERFEFLKYVVTKNWAKKSWKKYQISWCLPGSEGWLSRWVPE